MLSKLTSHICINTFMHIQCFLFPHMLLFNDKLTLIIGIAAGKMYNQTLFFLFYIFFPIVCSVCLIFKWLMLYIGRISQLWLSTSISKLLPKPILQQLPIRQLPVWISIWQLLPPARRILQQQAPILRVVSRGTSLTFL